ncbi:F-box/FBD/LRR-repeat protein At1g13570-like [Macadamia integrifolia]|uniref:F-box/FBD/LRR-repeat protein At1g13570-like n=1 Tax=Macadamia integrifolia TaxID=60698 RepID=UPI001C4EFDE6|nr:F-box/FBD/LRR-repeat protein At1g13570-like [Macadamia integrifolia]
MWTCDFSNIFGSLLAIQELFLEGWFLQSLSIGDEKRLLPSTYLHLKTISIELNVADMNEILVAIYLLNSSPNLQELNVLLWHDRESAIVPVIDLQEANDQLESTFNKLRVVDFSEFLGTEIELLLVRFILARSPVLETMIISHAIQDTRKVLTLLKGLLRFKRASQQAEIVYLDPAT